MMFSFSTRMLLIWAFSVFCLDLSQQNFISFIGHFKEPTFDLFLSIYYNFSISLIFTLFFSSFHIFRPLSCYSFSNFSCCCCCKVTSVVSDSVRPHRQQPTRLPCPWDSPGKNTGVGCHFLLQCMKVKSESEVAHSCPTLNDPMDCSPSGSSVHGFFQAIVLEWAAIAFSANFS